MTAVIEEGLRIFPSAPIGFVRTVPEGGDTVDGHFVPGGVSQAVFMAHVDKSHANKPPDHRIGRHVGSYAQRTELHRSIRVSPREVA